MKKLLILVAAFLCLGIAAQAQSTMKKGDLVVSARTGFSNVGIPVAISADYGIVNGFIDGNAAVSVGGELGIFAGSTEDRGPFVDFSLAARGNFHYEFVQNLDTYAGLHLGFTAGDVLCPYITANVGARYYFGNWGVNVELGGGTSLAGSVGVSLKL